MHKWFFTQMGHQTQRKTCNFAIQVANRFFENFAVEIGINASYNQLMDLGKELDTCKIDDEYELNNTHNSNNFMLNYHTESLQRIGEYIGHGKYNLSFEMCELDEVNYSIRRNDYHLRKTETNYMMNFYLRFTHTLFYKNGPGRCPSLDSRQLQSTTLQRERTTYIDPTPASTMRNEWIGGFSRGRMTNAQ